MKIAIRTSSRGIVSFLSHLFGHGSGTFLHSSRCFYKKRHADYKKRLWMLGRKLKNQQTFELKKDRIDDVWGNNRLKRFQEDYHPCQNILRAYRLLYLNLHSAEGLGINLINLITLFSSLKCLSSQYAHGIIRFGQSLSKCFCRNLLWNLAPQSFAQSISE